MASEKKGIGMWGGAFLRVGSMVGAGIFALLGEAGAVAGAAVWVSLGVFGSLPVNDVIAHGSIALAVAAIPVLGQAGFLLMAVAALISTTACTNSGLYAAGNVTRDMAMRGEFPHFLVVARG